MPKHLRGQILGEAHRGLMDGHFSGKRTFSALASHWWWDNMYVDTMKYVESCPECTITAGTGRHYKPPLHPIPVSRPFQIVSADLMELPRTRRGNKYVLVLQDYLTKWPLAYALPDQKALTIAHVLVEEVIPFFGVPEALLTDRGTNLLSHLMKDLCKLLGITKLNTTAYHPKCDGMVERFNRTLKNMLRKHSSRFRNQWDNYLSSMLWEYRNVPHESTGEKPSFLLFGWDLRTPTEAAFVGPSPLTRAEDYREEIILSLTSAHDLAAKSIKVAQEHYKNSYDRGTKQVDYRLGDWVFIRFPAEETGPNRKLSSPWHEPYRIVAIRDPDVTTTKVYFPQEGQIQVHQQRITHCPPALVTDHYWYGPKKHSEGKVPQWIENLMKADKNNAAHSQMDDTDGPKCKEVESSGNSAMYTRPRNTPDGCPYSLRKEINVPKRYQQAQDEL